MSDTDPQQFATDDPGGARTVAVIPTGPAPSAARDKGSPESGWLVTVVAVASGVTLLALGLRVGGALTAAIPGLPDAGPITTRALPVFRLLSDGLATVTVGMLMTAAFLLPGDGRSISPHGYLLLRRAGVTALGWSATALALIALTASDLLGQPLTTLGPATVVSFATTISQGQSLTLQAALALAVALLARSGVSRGLAATMAHGFFGLVLMQTTTVIAPDWYLAVHPGWASSLLADQKLGGGIAWAFGELPAVVVMIVLIRQWIRADQREQGRLDRAADRADATGAEDDLSRYNAFLAAAGRTDSDSRRTVRPDQP